MEDNKTASKKIPTWQTCVYCPNLLFNKPSEFERHIQDKHSIKEGSLIVCLYGQNGMCPSLQFGDLGKDGYKYHVREHHLYTLTPTDNWTFYSSSQNIPAVLNDPNRGKQANFFTKIWGDNFVEKNDIPPSPYLPEVTLSLFENYFKKIGKRYRRHRRIIENGPTKQKSPIIEIVCEIPSIFYQQSLPLNNAEVFNNVFPNLSKSGDASSTIRALQETLSTYLDVIEMNISKQVAQKSDAFFHAMLSHDTIMEQMATAVRLVQKTRCNVSAIKSNLTESPLKLVSSTRINDNLNNVHEQLKLMSTVQQTQPMIQLLLSTSDYVAALDLISSTQKVLSTQLSGIHAFRHLSPQLTEMQRLINKMLNSEFHKFAVTDLNRPPSDRVELLERDKLISIISGILRFKELDFIDIFKSEAMTTIQATIKQCVIEVISDRDGNSEIVLRGSNADNAGLLCNEGIIFLEKASPSLINLLKRIVVFNNLILEVSQMDDVTGLQSEDFWSKEEILLIEDKVNKMTASLSDYCNERCANLIVANIDKEYVFSDLSQLSKLTELIEILSTECELITGHYSNTMKLALRSLAMKFIQNLHVDRKLQLTESINTERWKIADVPADLQLIIDRICELGEIPPIMEYKINKPGGKYIIINKEQYAVVGTVQLLVKIVLEYCDATRQSPIISQYVQHCLLELVRLFNSRCCQLVLYAGALQSAGLKTITTSNLALVSRSLQVILWLFPIVQKMLEKHSNSVPLNGFSTLENDIVSHKDEIENKICFIVSNLLSAQLIGWDAKPPVPSQTFRSISKHLVKLHEALSNILPVNQIRTIYKKVHYNFKDKLREQLLKMNIVANGSPQHGVVTSELTFYLQTLKTLKIINDNDAEDNILYEIWIN